MNSVFVISKEDETMALDLTPVPEITRIEPPKDEYKSSSHPQWSNRSYHTGRAWTEHGFKPSSQEESLDIFRVL